MKMRGRKYWIIAYDQKKRFPKTGKGWVVEKVLFPTMNKGSQVVWTKKFKTKKEANTFKMKKLGKMM